MAFARRLGGLLRLRERLMPDEFAKGEPLESVLDRIVSFHPSISTTTLVVLQTSYTNRPFSRTMWSNGRALA